MPVQHGPVASLRRLDSASVVADAVAASSWSNDSHGVNFRRAYGASIERARFANAGVLPLRSSRLGSFNGDRVMHWQAAGGIVCLKEVWMGQPLQDSAICLRFGGALSACMLMSICGCPSWTAQSEVDPSRPPPSHHNKLTSPPPHIRPFPRRCSWLSTGNSFRRSSK